MRIDVRDEGVLLVARVADHLASGPEFGRAVQRLLGAGDGDGDRAGRGTHGRREIWRVHGRHQTAVPTIDAASRIFVAVMPGRESARACEAPSSLVAPFVRARPAMK